MLMEIGQLQDELATMAEQLAPLRPRLPAQKLSVSAPPGSTAARRAAEPPAEPVLTGEAEREARSVISETDEMVSRVRGVQGEASGWIGPLTADQQSTIDFVRSRQGPMAERIRRVLERYSD